MNLHETFQGAHKEASEVARDAFVSLMEHRVKETLKVGSSDYPHPHNLTPYYYPADVEGATQVFYTPGISLHREVIQRVCGLDKELKFDGVSFRMADDKIEILIVYGKVVIERISLDGIDFKDLLYLKKILNHIKSSTERSLEFEKNFSEV